MGAKARSPSPGPRRLGSLRWTWRISPFGRWRAQQVGDGRGLGGRRRGAVDHGREGGRAHGLHHLGGLGERVDVGRLVARERLQAVDDADALGPLGGAREVIERAGAAGLLVARRERPLGGGAVDQVAPAQGGAEVDQPGDGRGGGGCHGGVGVGDRQPLGRQQEPVEPRDDQPPRPRRPAGPRPRRARPAGAARRRGA